MKARTVLFMFCLISTPVWAANLEAQPIDPEANARVQKNIKQLHDDDAVIPPPKLICKRVSRGASLISRKVCRPETQRGITQRRQ